MAAYYNHPEMIFVLHEGKVDVNRAEGRFGETPLWMAVYWQQREAVRALLLCGANPETAPSEGDFKGTSCLRVGTSHSRNRDIVTLLRHYGAKNVFGPTGCPLRTSTDQFTCTGDKAHCEEEDSPSNRAPGTRPWWPELVPVERLICASI